MSQPEDSWQTGWELTFTVDIFHVSMKFHLLVRIWSLKLGESLYLPAPPLHISYCNTAACQGACRRNSHTWISISKHTTGWWDFTSSDETVGGSRLFSGDCVHSAQGMKTNGNYSPMPSWSVRFTSILSHFYGLRSVNCLFFQSKSHEKCCCFKTYECLQFVTIIMQN